MRFLRILSMSATAFSLLAAARFGGTAAAATSAPARSAVIAAEVAAAATYGQSHGLRVGVAVLDLNTGAFYGGGSYTRLFGTASVMKVMIATRLLITGGMTGATSDLATAMIERSDDVAASVLWPSAGGSTLEPWVARHYGIAGLGAPNVHAGYWGNTHVTARGLVQLYRAIEDDTRVAPWLLYRMHHYSCTASDGTDQCFGIASVAAGAAIKQGWGAHSADDFSDAIVNSTGFVDHDRYAVAILTEGRHNNSSDDAAGYNHAQGSVVSHMARLLLPDGRLDAASRHNPTVVLKSSSATGNTVSMSGWASDPDLGGRASTVSVWDGPRQLATVRADLASPGYDKHHAIHGNHRFYLRFAAPNGSHRFRVRVANMSTGTAGTAVRAPLLRVNGTARGAFPGLVNDNGTAVLTGWAADPDAGERPSRIEVRDNGATVGTWWADRPSAAVDTLHHLRGRHGFAVSLARLPDGTHSLCIYALNVGPSYSPARVRLRCREAVIANDPVTDDPQITAAAGAINVTGGGYDPNAPTAPISVHLIVDGHEAATTSADLGSASFDETHGVAGDHGFAFRLPVPAGDHTVELRYANTGRGADTTSATYDTTVPAADAGSPAAPRQQERLGEGGARRAHGLRQPATTFTICGSVPSCGTAAWSRAARLDTAAPR